MRFSINHKYTSHLRKIILHLGLVGFLFSTTVSTVIGQEPVIAITAPQSSDSFKGGDTVLVTGTAVDDSGNLEGEVEVFFDNQYQGSAGIDNGVWSYPLEAVTPGEHRIQAVYRGEWTEEWRPYRIEVGKFFTGSMQHMTFVCDDDAIANSTANAYFRNVKIYDDTGSGSSGVSAIDFSDAANARTSFTTSNDVDQDDEELENGAVLKLNGNTWRKIAQAYTVASNTVLEFEFKSDQLGEFHAIGLNEDNEHNPRRLFPLYGAQYAVNDYQFWNYHTYTKEGSSYYSDALDIEIDWFEAKINFQPESPLNQPPDPQNPPAGYTALPSDYVVDHGGIFSEQGNGFSYGWNADISSLTIDNAPNYTSDPNDADIRYISNIRMHDEEDLRWRWELAVPNGRYQVNLTLADTDRTYIGQLFLETELVDLSRETGESWIENTYEIAVQDNRLSLEVASEEEVNPICFIEVLQTGTKIDGYRYSRGSLGHPLQQNFVIPLDYQKGILEREEKPGQTSATYFWSQKDQDYTIPSDNPIATFGSEFGGSPVYTNQTYKYRVFAGWTIHNSGYSGAPGGPDFGAYFINVYDKKTGELVGRTNIGESGSWTPDYDDVQKAGYLRSFDEYDLKTRINGNDDSSNDQGVVFRHEGGNPDYIYEVCAHGVLYDVSLKSTLHPVHQNYKPFPFVRYNYPVDWADDTINNDTNDNNRLDFGEEVSGDRWMPARDYEDSWLDNNWDNNHQSPVFDGLYTYQSLYKFSVEKPSSWKTTLVKPQYKHMPIPQSYNGKSVKELQETEADLSSLLIYNDDTPPVQVDIASFNETTVNHSPELRDHPELTDLIEDYNSDPIALANYVFNEIELCDYLDYGDGLDTEASIDHGGVQRNALATYMEGQGSPYEQCALLIYLLRSVNVPCAYATAERNQLRLLDTVVSSMLGLQLKGVGGTPELIPVNYPWVVAKINNEWVHLFPWLKDTETVEGYDLYDHMPEEYNTGFKWFYQYAYANPEILSLSETSDQPLALWPKFIEKKLREEHPELSMDDIGIETRYRKKYFSRWEDFPKPTYVNGNLTLIESLKDTPTIFDTMEIEVYRKDYPSIKINTGEMLLCDLHNRKCFVRWSGNTAYLVLGRNRPITTSDPEPAGAPYSWPMEDVFASTANFDNAVEKQSSSVNVGTNKTLVFKTIRKRYRNHANGQMIEKVASGIIDLWNDFYYSSHDEISGHLYDPGVDDTAGGTIITNENDIDPYAHIAFCFHTGRVTDKMLSVHAREIWAYEETQEETPPDPEDPDIALGSYLYLMGMSYFDLIERFRPINQDLHKVKHVGKFSQLHAKFSPDSADPEKPFFPGVDVYSKSSAVAFGGAFNPNASMGRRDLIRDYNHIASAQGSAAEHGIINSFFGQDSAISTVKLLQMCQWKHLEDPTDTDEPGIVEFNINNYVTEGDETVKGDELKDHAPTFWTDKVVNRMSSRNMYMMTPGPVDTDTYMNMGLAEIDSFYGGAGMYISHSDTVWNGGSGEPVEETKKGKLVSMENNGDGTYTIRRVEDDGSTKTEEVPVIFFNEEERNYADSTSKLNGSDKRAFEIINTLRAKLGQPTLSVQQYTKLVGERSTVVPRIGPEYSDENTPVADPVNIITGEFYIDEVDISLNGVFPLEIRRNYSSQNSAFSEFGYGWKSSMIFYLFLPSDPDESVIDTFIYAAEMDGTVLTYEKDEAASTSELTVWRVSDDHNGELLNSNKQGSGSLANPYHQYIERQLNAQSIPEYTVYGRDGSVRIFTERTYTVEDLDKKRPYLDEWRDSRGNKFTFVYEEDAEDPDYGKPVKIESSNGSFLGFNYNRAGMISDVYTNDGRRLKYKYDRFGDLVKVIRPDNTEICYEYVYSTEGEDEQQNPIEVPVYSTHLIARVINPDGRVLENLYDDQRRVVKQRATVGSDLNPVRNAIFVYHETTPGTGWTKVYDAFNWPSGVSEEEANKMEGFQDIGYGNPVTGAGNGVFDWDDQNNNGLVDSGEESEPDWEWSLDPTNVANDTNCTTYHYSDSLFTQIEDPLGQTVQKEWFDENTTTYPDPNATPDLQNLTIPEITSPTPGGYKRSIVKEIDKRGLVTYYWYDSNGNIVLQKVLGDLTGDGVNDVAEYSFSYDSRNLILEAKDSSGITKVYSYEKPGSNPIEYLYQPTRIDRYANYVDAQNPGDLISSTTLSYVDKTGGSEETYGLLGARSSGDLSASSTDSIHVAMDYDNRGFLTSSTTYGNPGGIAPIIDANLDITESFVQNYRGELIESTDVMGRKTVFSYDLMGRLESAIKKDENDKSIAWNHTYYNANGEVSWVDGPKHGDAEDYIKHEYDGAGRVTKEIVWRSRAKKDGSGIEQVPGHENFESQSITRYEYDAFGNLLKIIDPNGNYTLNEYDAIGQLTKKETFDGRDGKRLSHERYEYDTGGLVTKVITSSGAEIRNFYTASGQIKRKELPDGTTTEWRYYLDGRVQQEIAHSGNRLEYFYDDVPDEDGTPGTADDYISIKKEFYPKGATVPEFIELSEFDRRGNLVRFTDRDGNVSTKEYDGLNRVTKETGPVDSTGSGGQQILTYSYPFNVSTSIYVEGETGLTLKTINASQQIVENAQNERTVTTFDALGRAVKVEVLDENDEIVSVIHTIYSEDHQSVLSIVGDPADSSESIVKARTFTDTFGNTVLRQRYTTDTDFDYSISRFDGSGNLIESEDSLRQTTKLVYDGLNRMEQSILPDGATTNLVYNAAGNLVKRIMPGGLTWSADYDIIGRLKEEKLENQNQVSRHFKFQYYPGSTQDSRSGQLNLKTDVLRGMQTVYSKYDTFSRLTRVSSKGNADVEGFEKKYEYDAFGRITSCTLDYPDNNELASSIIKRSYNANGQLVNEEVIRDTVSHSNLNLTWDKSGRRSTLSRASDGNGFRYGYRADGQLSQIMQTLSGSANIFAYEYSKAGLLKTRTNTAVKVEYPARDMQGRLLERNVKAFGANSVNGLDADDAILEEGKSNTFSWRSDSKLLGYSADRHNTTSRTNTYTYNARGQLVSEAFNAEFNGVSEIDYSFDQDKLGVLTRKQKKDNSETLSQHWAAPNGKLDAFYRIIREAIDGKPLVATGNAQGAGSLEVELSKLDGSGNPIETWDIDDVQFNPNSDSGDWQAELDLNAGDYQLSVTAKHPSGAYETAPPTLTRFTIGTSSPYVEKLADATFDEAGFLTKRTWDTGKTQDFQWDALGKLIRLEEQDPTTNQGFVWTAIYDGFGRRIQTRKQNTIFDSQNWVLQTGPGDIETQQSTYDPLVEFLEIAVSIDDEPAIWKVYGPDTNGAYGGLQGIGGLEATIEPSTGNACFAINDFYGHISAYVDNNGDLVWNPETDAYGLLNQSQAKVYTNQSGGNTTTLLEASVWRSYRLDPTGYYYMGARYYDSISGKFLSPDPLGHAESMDLYSYANGDPINFVDPTGRGAEGGQAGPNSFSPTSSGQSARDIKWKRSFWAEMYKKHGYNHPKYGPKSNRVDIVPVIEFLPTKWDTWKEIQTMEEWEAYTYFGPGSPTGYGFDKETAMAVYSGLVLTANVTWSFIPFSGGIDYVRVLNDPNATNFDIGLGYVDAATSFGFGFIGAFKAIGKFGSTSSAFAATNKGGGMFRRTSNIGEFADLPVNMSLKTVRQFAKQAGVGLDGVKVRIIRDPNLKGKNVFGFTHPNGKTIDLFPDAFSSPENLIRTLGHERTHIYQIKTFGVPKTMDDLLLNEKAAFGIEDSFVQFSKSGGN